MMNENNSYYESSVGYSSESYSADCGNNCGTLSTGGEVVSGNLSGTVVSAPVSGGGGGGGFVVPTAEAQALPTTTQPMQNFPQGVGGGEMPATTSENYIPNMPNTALGDDNMLYVALFLTVFAIAEISNLIYKKIK